MVDIKYIIKKSLFYKKIVYSMNIFLFKKSFGLFNLYVIDMTVEKPLRVLITK